MAQLPGVDLDDVTVVIVSNLSNTRMGCPLSHQEMRTGAGIIDLLLETAEASILAAVGPEANMWLVANPEVAREIVTKIQDKRREML